MPPSVCERYINCAEVLGDVPLSPILASYGPNGACWDTFEETVCFQDCRAGLLALGMANYDVAACRECETEDECAYLEVELSCTLWGNCVEPVEGEGNVWDPCYDVTDCMGECFQADECPSPGSSDSLFCDTSFGSFDGLGVCVDVCYESDDECFMEGWSCDLMIGICL